MSASALMAKIAPALAKLSYPKLHRPIQRPRLFALLQERSHHPLLWITGPPGAGKTTLVATFLQARKLRAIWYQVDAGDADLATFFYYLGQAAGIAARPRGTPLPLLMSEHLNDLPRFTRRFFRELYSRLPTPSALVLDNYQDVAAGSAFHGVIETALEELPAGSNLIVVSRAEPPPNFARALANNNVGHVGWDELRLTLEETSAISAGKTRLDEAALRSLHDQSNGWAAGLVLMLERLKRTGAVNHISLSETMDTVFDYFAGQIFDQSPAGTRDFLMRTACLPNVTVNAALQISGNPDAAKILDGLYRRHVFIERRVGEEVTYNYHDLFRQFLRSRAAQILGSSEFARVLSFAGHLLEADTDAENAFALYREANDWSAITELVLKNSEQLQNQGRTQVISTWIAALPRELTATSPWLQFWAGIALLEIDQPQAALWLEPAYDGFVVAGDMHGQLSCAAAIVESHYNEMADYGMLDRWVPILERVLADSPRFSTPLAEVRISAAALIALTLRRPESPTLPGIAARLRELLETDMEVTARISAGGLLLTHYMVAGDRANAAALVARLDPLTSDPHLASRRRILWMISRAAWLNGEARYPEAMATLAEAEALSEQNGFDGTLSHMVLLLTRFRTAFQQRDLAAAKGYLARAAVCVKHPSRLTSFYLSYYKAILALLQGRPDDAVEAGRATVALAEAVGVPELQRPSLIEVVASAYAMRRELDQALVHFREARACCTVQQAPLFDAPIAVIETLIALRDGANGTEGLASSVTMLKDTRNLTFLQYVPELVAEFAAAALAAGLEVDYVRELVARRQLAPPFPDSESWPWPIKVFTMGPFTVSVQGTPTRSTGKAQRKSLDLLQSLIALGGNAIATSVVIGNLWPSPEGDAGRAFESTLYRLRKLLGRDDAILLVDGKLTLNPKIVWVDAWALERRLDVVEGAVAAADGLQIHGEIADSIFALYRGHFLEGEGESAWMLGMRQRLRGRFLRNLVAVGKHLEGQGEPDRAARVYERGLELDNLSEELYRRLMLTYRNLGQSAGALEVYRRCRHLLSIVLGVKPSAETEAIYRSLKAG
jgi:ATP/maltotriose-dependent transcriptional regulator MalT/DNA-binding SARP family transcriptional activator